MIRISTTEAERLQQISANIRAICVSFITKAGWGHIGGSFSEAELMACLYGRILRVDPAAPLLENRDRFVLSKAHASPGYYAALALSGHLEFDELYRYCRLGGLDGHTQRGHPATVEYSGGSLGTGLTYACGLAKALRQKENFDSRVVCMAGDGELNEGQMWEAALFASQYKLDNLILLVDYNKVMAKGKMSEMISLESLENKLDAFGFTTISIDGHDIIEICEAFHRAYYLEMKGRPVAIVAHTVKGRGVRECEFNYKWHTHAPTAEKAREFLAELSGRATLAVELSKSIEGCPSDPGLAAIIGNS